MTFWTKILLAGLIGLLCSMWGDYMEAPREASLTLSVLLALIVLLIPESKEC